MEQSDADRAAVAREVLTEIANAHRELGFTAIVDVMESWRDEHYPAPPAPETVTVGDDVYSRRGDTWYVGGFNIGLTLRHRELLDRIASDARVIEDMSQRHTDVCEKWSDENRRRVQLTERIAAQEARIAELETQLQRALDGAVFHEKRAHHAEQERDAAWRALERERAANDTRIEYGTEPRGVVISGTLEEVKGEAGATVAASEPLASESPAATSPSPDPIPLGETVTVDGAKWARTELGWNGGAWRYHDSSTVARVLTALYRARHPVATRETVELVRNTLLDTMLLPPYDRAKVLLTAAGFTIQEGA